MKLFKKLFGEPGGSPRKSLQADYGSVQGTGRRSNQQDFFLAVNVKEKGAGRDVPVLLVVADGMGGMQSGEEASAIAAKYVEAAFSSMDMQKELAPQLLTAVLGANSAVHARMNEDGGSTLIACIIYKGGLYMASVGDSGVYLLRGDQFSRLNRAQNLMNLEYLSLIRQEDADLHSVDRQLNTHAITRFIGMEELDDVDFLRRPMDMQPGDVLLVCSDGVDGSLPEELIIDCLRARTPADSCRLLEEAIEKANMPYQDNYTALVYRYGD